ncbi:MAG: SIS domain-containing protein [Clostridia bacterium]|nr:SIS domain-containing protein [Clostridia bacterium]
MVYDFQALSEIFEQIPTDAPQNIAKLIHSHPRIFLYGAGRSGLMLKAFAMRLAQAGFVTFAVGETVTPAIVRGDLLIVASASGRTASVLRCAETARTVGATVCALTASSDAPLAALSDSTVLLHAPTKDSAPSSSIMGTLFEQSVLLLCDRSVEKLGVDADQMRARHANLE